MVRGEMSVVYTCVCVCGGGGGGVCVWRGEGSLSPIVNVV